MTDTTRPELDWLGALFLVAHVLVLPLLTWRSKLAIDALEAFPSRASFYVSVVVQQVALGAFTLFVAHTSGIVVWDWPAHAMSDVAAAALLFTTALGLAAWRWRVASSARRARMAQLLPHGARELAPWILVCVLAGVFEEQTYRRVLPELLARSGLESFTAIGASALVFGLVHVTQGWLNAALVAVFALGFHALVQATGSLGLAMAVHVLYDLVAGLAYGRLLRKHTARD